MTVLPRILLILNPYILLPHKAPGFVLLPFFFFLCFSIIQTFYYYLTFYVCSGTLLTKKFMYLIYPSQMNAMTVKLTLFCCFLTQTFPTRNVYLCDREISHPQRILSWSPPQLGTLTRQPKQQITCIFPAVLAQMDITYTCIHTQRDN